MIYRFVDGEPWQEAIFRPFEPKRPVIDATRQCLARGLSSFCSVDGIRLHRRAVPRFRTARVACGTIGPADGVVQHTPSIQNRLHHTWWLPAGHRPAERFTLVVVED
jgi:hypothetical protein